MPLTLAPEASWQKEMVPDCEACCTAGLIAPLSSDSNSDWAAATSAGVTTMPFEAANCSVSRSPIWLLSTALANVIE